MSNEIKVLFYMCALCVCGHTNIHIFIYINRAMRLNKSQVRHINNNNNMEQNSLSSARDASSLTNSSNSGSSSGTTTNTITTNSSSSSTNNGGSGSSTNYSSVPMRLNNRHPQVTRMSHLIVAHHQKQAPWIATKLQSNWNI